VNQLPGGVSTATVIPLHEFLSLDGVGWLYAEPGYVVGVAINFKRRPLCPVNCGLHVLHLS
jgi:hypothetical protein